VYYREITTLTSVTFCIIMYVMYLVNLDNENENIVQRSVFCFKRPSILALEEAS